MVRIHHLPPFSFFSLCLLLFLFLHFCFLWLGLPPCAPRRHAGTALYTLQYTPQNLEFPCKQALVTLTHLEIPPAGEKTFGALELGCALQVSRFSHHALVAPA